MLRMIGIGALLAIIGSTAGAAPRPLSAKWCHEFLNRPVDQVLHDPDPTNLRRQCIKLLQHEEYEAVYGAHRTRR